VFNIVITVCEKCSGPVRVVAETSDRSIEDPDVIRRILDHLADVGRYGDVARRGQDPPQLDFFA